MVGKNLIYFQSLPNIFRNRKPVEIHLLALHNNPLMVCMHQVTSFGLVSFIHFGELILLITSEILCTILHTHTKKKVTLPFFLLSLPTGCRINKINLFPPVEIFPSPDELTFYSTQLHAATHTHTHQIIS